jgi:hypothetical protein
LIWVASGCGGRPLVVSVCCPIGVTTLSASQCGSGSSAASGATAKHQGAGLNNHPSMPGSLPSPQGPMVAGSNASRMIRLDGRDSGRTPAGGANRWVQEAARCAPATEQVYIGQASEPVTVVLVSIRSARNRMVVTRVPDRAVCGGGHDERAGAFGDRARRVPRHGRV